jgi:hypothetical protein
LTCVSYYFVIRKKKRRQTPNSYHSAFIIKRISWTNYRRIGGDQDRAWHPHLLLQHPRSR